MPRYYFHERIGDQMKWDRAGRELPDIRMAPDPDGATALWARVLEGQMQPDRILVVTDEIGQVLFVSAR